MFEVWEVDAGFPAASNIASLAGEIVRISSPSGVPLRGIPSEIVDPSIEILDGFEEDKVALPPLIVKLKSETSRFPLPLLELYTASVNVIETTLLSTLSFDEKISGAVLSVSDSNPNLEAKALKFCVVSASVSFLS